MSGRFLDANELVELTGYQTVSKQIAWLRSKGIAFYVNGKGRPVVVAESLFRRPETVFKLGNVR